MKKKNVHRGVANMPSSEQDSNAPVLGVGKFSRIHRTYEKPRLRRRSRSRNQFSLFRSGLQYFLIVMGVALVAGLSWMIYNQSKNKNQSGNTTSLAEDTFRIPHPPATECENIVKNFLEISSVNDLKKTARVKNLDPDQAYQLFNEYRQKQGEIDRVEWAGVEETNGLSLEMVMVTYKSGRSRIAFLIPDQSHDWLVDVESYIGYNNRPWEQIRGQASCKAVIRVIATPDAYYNGVFSDDKEWKCIALTTPDREERLYGYIKTQSATELAFLQVLRSKNPAPVILEISRDAGMEPAQFEIKKVIAQGWVEADVEFETRYRKASSSSSLDNTAKSPQ
jgi:hypothetical protein